MKVLKPGHRYRLTNFNEPEKAGQEIQFIEKQPTADDPTRLETVNDGTTNEEVLGVLIDRLTYLQKAFPCEENAQAMTKLKEAKMWLEERTRNRQLRGVEGMQLA